MKILVSRSLKSLLFPKSFKANLDESVSPRTDFYQYACGGWCKNNPIPDDYSSFSVFDKLSLTTTKQLHTLLEQTSKRKQSEGSVEKKIGVLYQLCLDVDRREKEGLRPLQKMLSQIEKIESKNELSAILGKSMEFGFFDLYVAPDDKNSSMNILNEFQSGFTLGDRDYYVDEDERTVHIREEYKKHIAKMFELCGYGDGEERAGRIMQIETRLARIAKSNIELRDPDSNYNKMPVADLKKLVPEIDWDVYFGAMGIHTDFINIGQIDHIKEVGKVLKETSLEDLKTVFLWQTIDGAAIFLNKALYDQNFYFYEHILSGTVEQSPLWKRATRVVNSILGDAVGQMYVKQYFPEENKIKAFDIITRLKKAFAKRIKKVKWMEDVTKEKALAKLDKMGIKVGFPDKWRDYSKLHIDSSMSFYDNIRSATKFEQDYALSLLDKPVDKTKWHSYPQTVNAYYSPSDNDICFPAGILQPPFFDIHMSDAYNYATIGAIIGHEMTHGFDDEGRQFDEDGNLHNWWTEKDIQAFNTITNELRKYFDAIEVRPGVFNKGELTIGENIADQGGLLIALDAFKQQLKEKHPSRVEKQAQMRFFYLAFASIWAENIREEELLQQIKTDPHTVSMWRVLGTLAHINNWYTNWGITTKSPIFVPKEKRINIW